MGTPPRVCRHNILIFNKSVQGDLPYWILRYFTKSSRRIAVPKLSVIVFKVNNINARLKTQLTQPAFTCSKSTIDIPKQHVKSVQC